MGFFDNVKTNALGKKAYETHVHANELQKRGRMAEARVEYDKALELYEKAHAAGCRKTGVMMSYGVMLMRQGLFERARELMREISQNNKLSEDVHSELRLNYSICLWRLGELDKAIDTARYAGKHKKNSAYYSALGTFLVDKAGRTGDFEGARILLDEAMEYDDEDCETLDNYGEYYRQLGLKAQAEGDGQEAAALREKSKQFYLRAHKARPGQITTLYALARFAKEDGDSAKAKEYLDRAILHCSSKICPISIEELRAMRAEL